MPTYSCYNSTEVGHFRCHPYEWKLQVKGAHAALAYMSDHRQLTLQPSPRSARVAGEVGMVEEGIMGPTTLNNNIAMVGIDHERSRYPFCVVWSPLPPITWAIPFIGERDWSSSLVRTGW